MLFFMSCWDSTGVNDLRGRFSFSFLPTVPPGISLRPHHFGARVALVALGRGTPRVEGGDAFHTAHKSLMQSLALNHGTLVLREKKAGRYGDGKLLSRGCGAATSPRRSWAGAGAQPPHPASSLLLLRGF